MADVKERSIAAPTRLEFVAEARQYGVNADTWRVLVESIFPGARSPHSVVLALAYCKARGLDPFKRPIHIVPIWDSKRGCEVETIWPGIGELRTTAARTGSYAGADETVFGPEVEEEFTDEKGSVTVVYPEWAQVTVHRIVKGVRCPFVGPKCRWKATYATRTNKSDVPNTMWEIRAFEQLDKCAEAAALRKAFPEELGNDYVPEEVGGRGQRFESVGKTKEGVDIMRPVRASEVAAAAKETPPEAPAIDRSKLEKISIVSDVRGPLGTGFFAFIIGRKDGEVEATTFDTKVVEEAKKLQGKAGLAIIRISEGKKIDTKTKKLAVYTNVDYLEAIEQPKAAAVDDGPTRPPAQEEPGANG